MANFKAKMPVVATGTYTDGAAPTYADGLAIGKLINVGLTPNTNEGSLYGDDALAEYVREFSDLDVSLNVTTIPSAARPILFGETVTAAGEGTQETIVSGGGDSAHYVGFGFVMTEKNNDADEFYFIWIHKVKFALPSETYDTKGDSITFGTPTIEGKGTVDGQGNWRTIVKYDTEAAAIAALKTKAGISD